MTKLFVPSLLSLLVVSSVGQAAPRQVRAQTITKSYSFAKQPKKTFANAGVQFFFSDVPVDQAVNGRDLNAMFPGQSLPDQLISELSEQSEENLYQLTQYYNQFDAKVSGQAVAYHNRSDDTDTNFTVSVGDKAGEKLKPNTTYLVTAKLSFFSNVSSAAFGIGGSADSNSFGLVVSPNPFVAKAEQSSVPAPTPEPGEVEAPVLPYFGLPASFFVEASELADIAEASFTQLSEVELTALMGKLTSVPSKPAEFQAAMIKQLNVILSATLKEMSKPAAEQVFADVLAKKARSLIDANIQEKLAALSPEEIENLKGMAGNGGEPVLLMAAAAPSILSADGVTMLRTYTKDEKGQTVAVGVPSGTCAQAPEQWDAADKWVCERYSYMGRINNGVSGSRDWLANSLTTSVPVEVKTDANGSPIYLNLTSHSGFEGLTVYYVSGIEFKVVEKK